MKSFLGCDTCRRFWGGEEYSGAHCKLIFWDKLVVKLAVLP